MQLCCRSMKSCSSRLLSQHLLEAAWPGRLVTGRGPWSLCPVVWWEPHTGLPVLWARSQRVQPGSLEDKNLLWKKHLSLPLLTALAGPAFQPRTQRKEAVRLRKQVPFSEKGWHGAVRLVSLKPGHHTYKLITHPIYDCRMFRNTWTQVPLQEVKTCCGELLLHTAWMKSHIYNVDKWSWYKEYKVFNAIYIKFKYRTLVPTGEEGAWGGAADYVLFLSGRWFHQNLSHTYMICTGFYTSHFNKSLLKTLFMFSYPPGQQ